MWLKTLAVFTVTKDIKTSKRPVDLMHVLAIVSS